MTRLVGLLAVCLTATGTGCLMAGNYHSAKTLGEGESSFGMTFSATTYEQTDSDGEVDRISLPALIPELTYHVGVAENLEVGGRVAPSSLGLEADLKYRFLESGGLHLALAPALSYQTLIVISGGGFKLPLIATYELSPRFAVTAAVFGSAIRYDEVDPDDQDDDLAPFSGQLASSGASFGLEIQGETFVIRPGLEFTSYLARFGDDDNDFEEFNTVNVMVHFAFIGGREKKQLDRIERKLDQMNGGTPQ